MVHHDVTAIVLSCSWRQRAHTVFLRSVLYLPHIKGPHFFCAPPNFTCHAHPSTLYLPCHAFSDATQCSEEVQPAAEPRCACRYPYAKGKNAMRMGHPSLLSIRHTSQTLS